MCSGTYKKGMISYTEKVTSDQYTLADGRVCTVKMPYTPEQLTGTFTAPTTVSGTLSSDIIFAPCNDGTNVTFDPLSGNWTGQSSS